MFGWLFGGNKKEQEEKRKEREKMNAQLAALSPEKRELYRMSGLFGPDGIQVRDAIIKGNDARLKELLLGQIIPNAKPEIREQIMAIGKIAGWADLEELIKKQFAHLKGQAPDDYIQLGYTDNTEFDQAVTFSGDGHLLTIAPTGAGKGQAHILPTLLEYEGSAVVFDPKGEAYRETAWMRRLYGPVYKWAPFEDETDCINPLEMVENWEDAVALADLLIVPEGNVDPFWDRSARMLVAATIMLVKTKRPPERCNMREVLRALSPSREEYEAFLDDLRASGEESLVETSNQLEELDDKLRTSVYQTARSHMDAWRSPEISRATAFTSKDFYPDLLFDGPFGDDTKRYHNQVLHNFPDYEVLENGSVRTYRGSARSFFIIVPPDRIQPYRSVIRVIVGMMINSLIKFIRMHRATFQGNPDEKEFSTYPKKPILFMLDEFPQLGHMSPLVRAIELGRSYRMRFWLFTQDKAQLESAYKIGAQTIMDNCRVKIFFQIAGIETAKYVSEHIGNRKDLWGNEDLIAPPQELMSGDKFRDHQIILAPGVLPIRSRLRYLYKDERLKAFIDQHHPKLANLADRPNMEGRLTAADRYAPPSPLQNESEQVEQAPTSTTKPPAPKPAPAPEKQDFGIDDPQSFDKP